jgi:hypothetical protein
MKELKPPEQTESVPKQQNSKSLKSCFKETKPKTKLSFKNKVATNLPGGEPLIPQDSSQM